MIRINLLRPEAKEFREGPALAALPGPEIKEKKALPIGNLIILLIVAVLAVLIFLQMRAISRERNLLQAAQEEKGKLQYVVAKLEELELQKAIFERKINLINQLKARQETAVRIMDELSKRLPEWVWLTDVSFEGQLITMKGNALSNNLIADYIFNLENSPHLSDVNLISSTQKTTKSAQYLEFLMNMNYVLPMSPLPPEAAAPAKTGTKVTK